MSPRKFLLILAAVAAAGALLEGVTGVTELALYAGPLLLVVALLLGGRFVGEERILARLGALRRPRATRPASARRDRERELPLVALLAGTEHPRRGPPAALAAA